MTAASRTAPSRPGQNPPLPYYNQTLEALGQAYGFKLTDRWADLPAPAQRAILHGTDEKIEFHYADGARSYKTTKTFEGIVPNLERKLEKPIPPGRARRSGASCRPRPARLATAIV